MRSSRVIRSRETSSDGTGTRLVASREGTRLSRIDERIETLKMHLMRDMGGPVAHRRQVEEALDSLPKLIKQNEQQRRTMLLMITVIVVLLSSIGFILA